MDEDWTEINQMMQALRKLTLDHEPEFIEDKANATTLRERFLETNPYWDVSPIDDYLEALEALMIAAKEIRGNPEIRISNSEILKRQIGEVDRLITLNDRVGETYAALQERRAVWKEEYLVCDLAGQFSFAQGQQVLARIMTPKP